MKLKKLRNNIFSIITIYILIIIFIHGNNIWRKFYNVLNNNYDSRLIKKNGFCGGDSYGFLQMVKKKHLLKENPMILNYEVLPNSIWTIYDASKKTSKSPNILLNYDNNFYIELLKKDNIFASNQHFQHTNKLDSIKFILKEDKIKINGSIRIFKILNSKEYIIFEKKINQILFNNKELKISFVTEKFNSRWGTIYLDFKNIKSNKIQKIILKLNNKYNLSKYEIIEKYKNCYYIK